MKNDRTILIFGAAVVAGLLAGCGMTGNSNSNAANSPKPANANANTASTARKEDLPMLAAPKLAEMLITDAAGTNASLKDKEVIVLGELKMASNGDVVLSGGALRDIYCSPPPAADPNQGWSDDYKKLEGVSAAAKKPIVEVRGTFTKGTFETAEGLRNVNVFLAKCSIVSIQ